MIRRRVYRYRVPWRSPPGQALGRFREGFLVRIEREGGEGRGECAPWPGIHPGTLTDYGEMLLRWAREGILPVLPPASFAVSTALEDLEHPLNEVVFRSAALLPLGHPVDDLPADTAVLKVKLGTDPSENETTLGRVRDRFPDAELRVDFGSRPTFDEARRHVPMLHDARVRYVEEPLDLPARLPDYAELGLPVALDETLRRDPALLTAPWLAVAVIKPEAEPGDPRERFDAVEREHKLAVSSACFPTDVGLFALARIEALAHRALAPGFGTRRFLDLDGLYAPSDAPGVLVRPEPNWSALEELR